MSRSTIYFLIALAFIIASGTIVIAEINETRHALLASFENPITIPRPTTTAERGTEGSSPSLTASWRTYRNEEYGFEFKYPANLILEKNEGFVVLRSVPPDPNGEGSEGWYYWVKFATTTISSPDQWFSNSYGDRDPRLLPSKQAIDFFGYPALSIADPVTEGGCDSAFIAILHNGYVYNVQDPGCYGESAHAQTINAINKSFKFIVPLDTSTWQTYRNEEYGFEVRYPPEWIVEQTWPHQIVFDPREEKTDLLSQTWFVVEREKDANPQELDIQERYTRKPGFPEPEGRVSEALVTVAGQLAWRIESQHLLLTYSYYIARGKDIMSIIYPRTNREAIPTQILSTFKFTK